MENCRFNRHIIRKGPAEYTREKLLTTLLFHDTSHKWTNFAEV